MSTFKGPGPSAILWGVSAAALALAGMASAQTQSPDEITVIGKAAAIAPSTTPLDVFQPTSIVQAGFLKNNIIPLASVDDIIKYQPSVWSSNPNGPGIGKAETLSLRGFQDSSGQFNVTFDGIPFGDATDLHHTTSSLFIAHDLDSAEVDRGPGTASTIGKATFGGTIGFISKAPSAQGGVNVYGTYGSFNTHALGVEVQSGQGVEEAGYVDIQHEETDGYLTGSPEKRTNIAGKYVLTPGPNTTVTVLGGYNHEFQYTTQGATLAEYAEHGDNYGLCNNPALQCFYGYQPSDYYSSFLYVDVKTKLGPVRVHNTLYDDSFEHDYSESKDASDENAADNGVTFYSPTTLKKLATDPTDIPGKRADAKWNAFGDIIRAAVDTPLGELRAGFWFDEQDDNRYSYNSDVTQGGVQDVGKKGTAYSYIYKDIGTTLQPYVELEWKPIEGLSVVPGVKYTNYSRMVDAAINKSTLAPLRTTVTYDALQPSGQVNYRIRHDLSVYGQIAKGFQAPPIDLFQVNVIKPLKPEETTNYQLGATWRPRNLTLSADVYYIDFDNLLSQQQVAGSTDTTFVNGGGAIYQGVELEGQYALPIGLSLYGSYSYNSAKYKHTSVWIAEAPEWMASAGVLYENRSGPYFSLIGKVIGPRYGDDGGGVADAAVSRIGDTFTADLAAGYHFMRLWGVTKPTTVSVKVSNLFDRHDVSDFAGYQAVSNTPLYWRAPGRSVFVNLDAKF